MGGNSSASDEAAHARRQEEQRQNRIRKGTASIDKTFDQFDNKFFKGQETAYKQYAVPQLRDQYSDAGEDLTYHLARRGMLDSSTRGEKEADLGKLYETERQKVASDAVAYGTDAKNNVEGARGDLVSMLQSTGDNVGAAQGALTRASALSRPPSYSPLAQLFLDFTAGLGAQAGFERNYAAGGARPRYNTGLFGPSSRSVVNT